MGVVLLGCEWWCCSRSDVIGVGERKVYKYFNPGSGFWALVMVL